MEAQVKDRFTTYRGFVKDHYEKSVKALEEKDFQVKSREDFDSYVAWKERGRVIKRGEKATQVFTDKVTATPVFNYGSPVLDEKGRQKFTSIKRNYHLFHIDQTELLTETTQ